MQWLILGSSSSVQEPVPRGRNTMVGHRVLLAARSSHVFGAVAAIDRLNNIYCIYCQGGNILATSWAYSRRG